MRRIVNVFPDREPPSEEYLNSTSMMVQHRQPKQEGIAGVFKDLTGLEVIAFSKCAGVGLAIEDEILAFLKAYVS